MKIKVNDQITLYQGNCLDVLDQLPDNSVDSIVTDPPYEIGFMGKGWDSTGVAFQIDTWKKALRVLKSGGYLLAFNHSRQFHRMAVAIEDAGFEIRDTIMWLYGSGFPKSLNVAKAIDKHNSYDGKVIGQAKGANTIGHTFGTLQKNYDVKELSDVAKTWQGWGTSLKPAFEPIVLARKPLEGSVAANVLKYGVGGINIDGCRVGDDPISTHKAPAGTFAGGEANRGSDTSEYNTHTGRWPANVIHDGSSEVINMFPNTISSDGSFAAEEYEQGNGATTFTRGDFKGYGDEGSAARFFYSGKANKKDRDEGLDLTNLPIYSTGELQGGRKENSAGSIMANEDGSTRLNPYAGAGAVRRNIHPTVKPTDLMQYLVRLITPKGGTVLDFFMGSGSTGKAVIFENAENKSGYKFIGVELDPSYIEIAKARLEWSLKNADGYKEIIVDGKKILDKPISIFDQIPEEENK
jgi:site-specific DNA-methyltransferase (adenine-specific)